MFHFPASTPTQTMHSSAGNTTQPVLGFPIRTSSDQRFVDNSPRLNAASHVLHRLSMPRHPPYALNNQKITQHDTTHTTHTKQAMHADTQNTYKTVSQTTKTCKTQKSTHTPQTMEHGKKKDARVHYTVLTQHTHTTTTTHNAHDHSRAGQQDNHNHTQPCDHCVLPQTPNSMPTHQKHCLRKNGCIPWSATQALHVLRVCIHPEIFNTFFSGSHTHGDSTTNTPTTVGTILKAP